jgi:dTDP-glucose 4,6-dehydratase
LEGKRLPIYGKGDNVRDWLYVEDHAKALRLVLTQGQPGRTYNIGGRCEKTNLEVVQNICRVLDELVPADERKAGAESSHRTYSSLITFVSDRPGHDRRYAIDDSHLKRELGWDPAETFVTGLKKTVRWYVNNTEWVNRVRSGEYQEWIRQNYALQGRG